jgi:hypothetical protein
MEKQEQDGAGGRRISWMVGILGGRGNSLVAEKSASCGCMISWLAKVLRTGGKGFASVPLRGGECLISRARRLTLCHPTPNILRQAVLVFFGITMTNPDSGLNTDSSCSSTKSEKTSLQPGDARRVEFLVRCRTDESRSVTSSNRHALMLLKPRFSTIFLFIYDDRQQRTGLSLSARKRSTT